MWALRPDLYVHSVAAINLDDLAARGVRGLVLDVDNTLVERNQSDLPPEVDSWIRRAQQQDFRLCLVSNSIGSQRVAALAERWNIPAIAWAIKPRRRPFRQAMRMMGTTAHETAVIGDQLLTDVLGARRLGLFIILVEPLTRNDFIVTRLSRCIERLLLRRFLPCGSDQQDREGEAPGKET